MTFTRSKPGGGTWTSTESVGLVSACLKIAKRLVT